LAIFLRGILVEAGSWGCSGCAYPIGRK